MSKNFVVEKRGIGQLSVTSYPKKEWFTIIFLHVWLVGWVFGEVSAVDILFFEGSIFNQDQDYSDDIMFLYVWLIFWTFGGSFAVYYLLWMMFGEEHVSFDKEQITITRVLAFIKRKRRFKLSSVINLGVKLEKNDLDSGKKKAHNFSSNYGSLRFNYSGKEIKFGLDLSEEDALYIYEEIRTISRFTNLVIE